MAKPVLSERLQAVIRLYDATLAVIRDAFLDEIAQRAREIDVDQIVIGRGGSCTFWKRDQAVVDHRIQTLTDTMHTFISFDRVVSRWNPRDGWTHTVTPH